MEEIVKTMAEVFKAFGDPTRLRIMRILASNTDCNLCVGALARKLGVTQPAVSQHLKVLKNVGLLDANRRGYRVHYAINSEKLALYKTMIDKLLTPDSNLCSKHRGCQKHDV